MSDVDVIIVGAGYSGLTCMAKLKQLDADLRVTVLEANSRIGGRVETVKSTSGHYCDLGGMWVGATQHRLKALLSSLDLETYPQYLEGSRLLDHHGVVRRYTGMIPRVNLVALVELQIGMWRIDRWARQVPLENPHSCPFATVWDGQTLQSQMDELFCTQTAKEMLQCAVMMVWGVQPTDISFLYFLFYVHAAGGLEQLLEAKNAAQDSRIKGGAGRVLERLINVLRKKHTQLRVITSCEVTDIETKDNVVKVRGANGFELTAKRVVLATPPSLHNQIIFTPPLPATRMQANARSYMGSYTKVICFYEEPFWRQQGCSGEAVNTNPSLDHPVIATFDYCAADMSHVALVAFTTGETAQCFSQLTPDQQRAAVLRSLERFFGPPARLASDVIIKEWIKEPFTKGCPVNIFPAGSYLPVSQSLRTPSGNIHYAATETAREWAGYIEGAIEAGERAATEVHQALSGIPLPASAPIEPSQLPVKVVSQQHSSVFVRAIVLGCVSVIWLFFFQQS